jgi:hypothetical protein
MKDYRIKPGTKVNLSEWDPKETGDFYGGKDEGLAEIATLNKKLAELQVLLYAGHRHKLLIV